MNFRKFKNVEYLEKLLAKKTEQLKMQRQRIEDLDKAIFFLGIWATPSVSLRVVERDLEGQQSEAEVLIEELKIEAKGLEEAIKEMRGNKNNGNNE